MNRSLYRVALISVAGIGLTAPAVAQDTTVQAFDKTKNAVAPVSGKLVSEDASKIVLKPNIGPNKEIAATDVVDVTYEIRAALVPEYNSPRTLEAAAAK